MLLIDETPNPLTKHLLKLQEKDTNSSSILSGLIEVSSKLIFQPTQLVRKGDQSFFVHEEPHAVQFLSRNLIS